MSRELEETAFPQGNVESIGKDYTDTNTNEPDSAHKATDPVI